MSDVIVASRLAPFGMGEDVAMLVGLVPGAELKGAVQEGASPTSGPRPDLCASLGDWVRSVSVSRQGVVSVGARTRAASGARDTRRAASPSAIPRSSSTLPSLTRTSSQAALRASSESWALIRARTDSRVDAGSRARARARRSSSGAETATRRSKRSRPPFSTRRVASTTAAGCPSASRSASQRSVSVLDERVDAGVQARDGRRGRRRRGPRGAGGRRRLARRGGPAPNSSAMAAAPRLRARRARGRGGRRRGPGSQLAPARGDGALAGGDPAGEADAAHLQSLRRARQRSTVFARRSAIVSGPTPPGTGV